MSLDTVQTTTTGLSARAFYFNATPGGASEGQVWNGTAFEAWTDAHYATYAIAAGELGTSARYQATTPAAVAAAGPYSVVFRKYSGTLASDTPIGSTGVKQASVQAYSSAALQLLAAATVGMGGTVWYVSTAGNDASDGKSWATGFATPQHAAAVAVANDLILLGAGTFNLGSSGTFAPAAGVNVIGAGMGATVLTGASATALCTISGNSEWTDFAIVGNVANGSFQLPLSVASNANAVIRRVAISGQTDCIYFSGVSNATLRAYECPLTTQWDGVFLQACTGCTLELHDCPILSAGPVPSNFEVDAPFFSTGVGLNDNTSTNVFVFGGSITAYGQSGTGSNQVGVHTNGGAVWLFGTAVSTSGAASTLTDLYQDHVFSSYIGSILVAGASYSQAKTSGTITQVPADANIVQLGGAGVTVWPSASQIAAAVAAATAGTTMTVLNPVANGSVSLFVGRAYKAAYGNSLDFYRQANSTWPADFTGWTITMVIAKTALNVNTGDATDTWAMTIQDASGSGQMIRLELTSNQTATLAAGQPGYTFKILGQPPSSSDSVALMSGNVSVSP